MAEKVELTDKQKRQGFGCLAFIVIAIVIVVIILNIGTGENKKTFDFTVKEYESSLKQVIDANKGNSFISIEKSKLLEEGAYTIGLTNGMSVHVFTNKKDKVKKVGVAASSNSFLVQNNEVMIAFQALLKSVDSSLSVPQQLVIFDNLGIDGGSGMLDHSSTYTLDDIKYSYQGDIEDDVIFLTAQPQ